MPVPNIYDRINDVPGITRYYLDNCDEVINEITQDYGLPYTQKAALSFKSIDDLRFIKTCCRIYADTQNRDNWVVDSDMNDYIISFLKEFKNSTNKLSYSKSIDVINSNTLRIS